MEADIRFDFIDFWHRSELKPRRQTPFFTLTYPGPHNQA